MFLHLPLRVNALRRPLFSQNQHAWGIRESKLCCQWEWRDHTQSIAVPYEGCGLLCSYVDPLVEEDMRCDGRCGFGEEEVKVGVQEGEEEGTNLCGYDQQD